MGLILHCIKFIVEINIHIINSVISHLMGVKCGIENHLLFLVIVAWQATVIS